VRVREGGMVEIRGTYRKDKKRDRWDWEWEG